jgi:hypothetical protein
MMMTNQENTGMSAQTHKEDLKEIREVQGEMKNPKWWRANKTSQKIQN